MFSYLPGLIDFQTKQYYFRLRARFWSIYTIILCLFDPVPLRKKNETVPNYVLRLNKRHALRELNFYIGIIHSYDIDGINYMLQRPHLSKDSREYFAYLKEQSELKKVYIYLREQIKRSED
jgi:hypothetical protein